MDLKLTNEPTKSKVAITFLCSYYVSELSKKDTGPGTGACAPETGGHWYPMDWNTLNAVQTQFKKHALSHDPTVYKRSRIEQWVGQSSPNLVLLDSVDLPVAAVVVV